MRWQCPYCVRQFSKPLSLSKHVSEKHPFQDEENISNIIENDSHHDVSNLVSGNRWLPMCNCAYWFDLILNDVNI
jgi:hypothetical protein